MHIAAVFQTVSLAKSVAEYSGIVESIEKKIDRLMGAELECGWRTLKQATCSTVEQTSLLREARSCFNKAISLEKEERLVIAYLGLAVCHSYLGDETNAKDALQELLKIEFPISVVKIIANNPKLLFKKPVMLPLMLPLLPSYALDLGIKTLYIDLKIGWKVWNNIDKKSNIYSEVLSFRIFFPYVEDKDIDKNLVKSGLTDSQLKCMELQNIIHEYLETKN